MKKILCLVTASVIFSSCATIFLPKKQRITINTGNPESTIYVDKEEFGKGSFVTAKTKKDGSKQLVIKTPGYKDKYAAIVQTHRPLAYWLLQIPNPVWLLYYGFYIDAYVLKNSSYDKVTNIPIDNKLVTKGSTDKYIDISSIKLNIRNKNKDISDFYLNYSPDLYKDIEMAEKDKEYREVKAETAAMKKKKKKKAATLQEEDTKLVYDDTKFSYNVYRTLKNTGFVDTVNRVFSDNNNSLVLEGSINKIYVYTIYGKKYGAYKKTKLFLTWYIKNTYGEVLDSIDTKEYSGDFVFADSKSNTYEKMFGDAIDISYLNLHKNADFLKLIKQENNFTISDPVLTLPAPKAIVAEKSDAASASVIVKTSNGHGSGFAITNDGYIITNYHVISGRLKDKAVGGIKIINVNGEEVEAKVVRYNKFRDLALLKVDKSFDRAFKCSNVKSFKNLQDVYTIGAPKSLELGQSISSGVISNERKNNNNNLLQLGMSVNSGNSGGPLFDAAGNLHGVIVSKLVGQNTEGVSFAIPGYLLEDYLKIKF